MRKTSIPMKDYNKFYWPQHCKEGTHDFGELKWQVRTQNALSVHVYTVCYCKH